MKNVMASFISTFSASTSQSHLRTPESLRRNFIWVFGGNAIYALCNWGILIILAKLGSTEAVGQFALGLAIASPVFIFTSLNLRAVQATDAKNLFNYDDYFRLRYITIALAVAATLVISVLLGYDGSLIAIILAVAILKSVDSASDISHGLYQKNEIMFYIAKALAIKGPISLLVFLTTFLVFGNIVISILSSAAFRLLVFVLYERPLGRAIIDRAPEQQAVPRQRSTTLVQLALLSLPLGVVAMINSLSINIPRFFVEKFNGMEQLGIFAGIAYIMVAGVTVVTAMGQSASPRLARYFADEQFRAFGSLLARLIAVGVVLGASGIGVAVLWGTAILKILYSSEYASHGHVFVLVMIAALFGYVSSFLGFGMTAARKFKIQAPISMLSLLVIFASSLVLIPRYGIVGACYCMIILNLVQIPVKLLVILHSMRTEAGA